MVTQEVNRILKRYGNDPTDIIAILQDVQQTYRYLPREVLEYISGKIDVPLSRMYHLSTFFRAFSLEQRGKHEIHVCLGTACHVRGAPRILEAFERGLKISAGKTTPDMQCTLETVNCVGACALGPVIIVDEKSVGKMNPQKAERLLKQMNLGADAGVKEEIKVAAERTKAPVQKKKAPAVKKKVPVKKKAAPAQKKKAAAAKKGRAPVSGKTGKSVAKKGKKTVQKAR
jgi:NADH-quinone oxidoreductase subunit E